MFIHANIEPLRWESDFFGIKSAILRPNKDAPILTVSDLSPWSRVQAKIPAFQAEYLLDALKHLGFQLVEGEIEFAIIVKSYYEDKDSGAEIAEKADIPVLRHMAKSFFLKSRFCYPWYTIDARGQFYAQWIENAVLGVFDDTCLVFRDKKGEIEGFVSLRRLSKEEARIGLLAGHRIGKKLIKAALRWSQQQQLTILRATTQIGNVAAIKCYVSGGIKNVAIAYWLYR